MQTTWLTSRSASLDEEVIRKIFGSQRNSHIVSLPPDQSVFHNGYGKLHNKSVKPKMK